MNDLFKKTISLAVIVSILGTNIIAISGESTSNNIQLTKKPVFYKDLLFDLFIRLMMKLSHMPSLSTCIVKNNEVVWAKGYGLYDIENGKKTTEDTMYIIASISKTITATALMQLYDQGLFNLDDNVSEYLSFDLKNPNHPDVNITFRMLLAHQSSLAEDPEEFYQYFTTGDCQIPLYPWLETYLIPGGNNYTSKIWSNDHPGEKTHYSNVGYTLIGYLVECISNKPFDQYCIDNIFIPLGMLNTSYRLSDLDVDQIAIPYKFSFGKYIPYEHYGFIDYPAGSVRTSVTELSHFLIAHLNRGLYHDVQILNESTIELMHTVQYHDNKVAASEYGLGWQIWEKRGVTFSGHEGGDIGTLTSMKIRDYDNVSVICFTNVGGLLPYIVLNFIVRVLFTKADRL